MLPILRTRPASLLRPSLRAFSTSSPASDSVPAKPASPTAVTPHQRSAGAITLAGAVSGAPGPSSSPPPLLLYTETDSLSRDRE